MYFCSVPSKVLDKSQAVTQKVSGTISKVVSPIKPLQSLVDITGSGLSNVLGSSSRLLGKEVEMPPRVIFLYNQPLRYQDQTQQYMDAVKKIIGLMLINVIWYSAELNAEKVTDLSTMPMLESMAKELKNKGAHDDDIDDLVTLLGGNGRQDITREIRGQVRAYTFLLVMGTTE